MLVAEEYKRKKLTGNIMNEKKVKVQSLCVKAKHGSRISMSSTSGESI